MVIVGNINAKLLSQTQVALRNGKTLKNLAGQQYILFTNATETWGVGHFLVGLISSNLAANITHQVGNLPLPHLPRKMEKSL